MDHFCFWYVCENLFTLICFMYMVFFLFDCMHVYLFVFLLCKMIGALLLLLFCILQGLNVLIEVS